MTQYRVFSLVLALRAAASVSTHVAANVQDFGEHVFIRLTTCNDTNHIFITLTRWLVVAGNHRDSSQISTSWDLWEDD